MAATIGVDMIMAKDIKGHLFNLLIYTTEKRRADYFERMVLPLTEKFPSRVIHIRCEKEGKNHVSIEQCDEKCEQLTLSSSLQNVSEIPFNK